MTQNINLYENYRKIVCVSLSKFSLFDTFLESLGLANTIYYSKKNKSTLHFYNGFICNDIQLSYLCKSVDAVVFLIDENSFCDDKIALIKKNIPSYIFVCINESDTKFGKKYIEKKFGDGNIVKTRQVIDKLCTMKLHSTKVYCDRPSFVMDSIKYESDGYYYGKGFLRDNLVGKRVVMNGIDEFEIVEVNNSAISIQEIDEFDLFEEKHSKSDLNDLGSDDDSVIESKDDQLGEEKSEDKTQAYEDMDIEDDSVESNESCYENNLIEKYKDHCSLQNLKTCQYITKEYPKYFQGITLFENIKEIERRLIKLTTEKQKNTSRKSLVHDCNLKLRRLSNKLNLEDSSIFVCYNIYSFENKLTVYNMEFTCIEELQPNTEYIADFGHLILPIVPLISNAGNGNTHKYIQSSKAGVITFIAPLILNLSKILIYKNVCMLENLIGQATNNSYKERVVLEEALIVGKAKKIDKRYCTIIKMFNTKEEVLYYRNMPLTCKNGNMGIIKKPIGTYGVFKAYFNKPVTHEDKICVKLYKRVFPVMPKYL